MSEARTLLRYAALLRSRRKARRREANELADPGRWSRANEELVLPALLAAARARLPRTAGPFHKSTLTLSALEQVSEADAGLALALLDRYRKLLAIEEAVAEAVDSAT